MASSANSIDWMPAKGRHPVNIGSSLGRALKNRKNKGSPAPATKRSNLPERDFYCFKFNFKASSVDTSRPAAIEIKKGPENNHVTAEYPSTQAGEVHMFSGNEQPAKDVDCILIFDEETGTFTLEKLDSFVLLKFDRKQAASSRPDSPAPLAASSSSSSAKGKGRQEDYDMDRGMSTMDEDAEGEVDTQEPAASSIPYQREEGEEEEEGEEVEIPLRQALQSKAKPPAPALAPARPVKSLPKSRTEAKVAPPTLPTKPKMPPPPVVTPAPVATKAPAPAPAKSKPPPAATKTKKTKAAAAPLSSYASEEIIEFGRPAKRVRPSTPQQPPPPPPAPAPVALSLPGGSSSFAPPPAPASYRPGGAAGSPSTNNSNDNGPAGVTHPEPIVSAPMDDADLSEEDEDWEQVPTATPTIPQAANPAFSSHLTLEEENQLEEEIFGNGFAEEGDGEMDDEDEYEEGGVEIDPFELEEQMEEEGEDFLNGVLSPAPEQQQQQTRRPMSMNELAGGGAGVGVDSDDEFSSSDESEDD